MKKVSTALYYFASRGGYRACTAAMRLSKSVAFYAVARVVSALVKCLHWAIMLLQTQCE